MTILAVAAVAGCARGPAPRAASEAAAPRSIMLGDSEIDPPDLSMRGDETLTFISTATQPLRLEFVQPSSGQSDRIRCRPSTAAATKPGEAAWETFHANAEGHLVADIPPGQLQSVCTLAPGAYAYDVRVVAGEIRSSQLRTTRQGTITVK